jgi:hypothetical protein
VKGMSIQDDPIKSCFYTKDVEVNNKKYIIQGFQKTLPVRMEWKTNTRIVDYGYEIKIIELKKLWSVIPYNDEVYKISKFKHETNFDDLLKRANEDFFGKKND